MLMCNTMGHLVDVNPMYSQQQQLHVRPCEPLPSIRSTLPEPNHMQIAPLCRDDMFHVKHLRDMDRVW